MRRSARLLQVEAERAARPREGDLELRELKRAHARRAGGRRQAGLRGEEAGDVRRQLVDAERLGRRAVLEREARQPEGDVEGRVADAGVIPVDEDGAAVAEAEVVAADVAVQELVAAERRIPLSVEKHGQREIEPLRRGEPEG